jgi:hypothetical protein
MAAGKIDPKCTELSAIERQLQALRALLQRGFIAAPVGK